MLVVTKELQELLDLRDLKVHKDLQVLKVLLVVLTIPLVQPLLIQTPAKVLLDLIIQLLVLLQKYL